MDYELFSYTNTIDNLNPYAFYKETSQDIYKEITNRIKTINIPSRKCILSRSNSIRVNIHIKNINLNSNKYKIIKKFLLNIDYIIIKLFCCYLSVHCLGISIKFRFTNSWTTTCSSNNNNSITTNGRFER